MWTGKQSTHAPVRSAGVVGTARGKGKAGNRGRPARDGGSGLDGADRAPVFERVSDRVVRPGMPGNSGGGKDPDFWYVFDKGKVTVIGDEPDNAG